jgi:hypothetical protein
MQINVLQSGSGSRLPLSGGNPVAKVQQDFQNLGSALESGNLADARKAFAQLQTDAPSQGASDSNPLSSKIDSLGKALDSGDMKAAQEAYSKIKEAISQRPPAGGHRGGPSSEPPGDGQEPSGSRGSSQSNTTYDKKDANKDGTVSAQEEYEYDLTHPAEAKKGQQTLRGSDNTTHDGAGGTINIEA